MAGQSATRFVFQELVFMYLSLRIIFQREDSFFFLLLFLMELS